MKLIGQQIYQLESYTNGRRIYINSLKNPNEFDSSGFFQNIKVYKLGIQAPPGTTFSINDKDIIIGLSGLYELYEEGIIISSLKLKDKSKKNIIIDYIYEEQEDDEIL